MFKMSSASLHVLPQPISITWDSFVLQQIFPCFISATFNYPRRARSALGVDIVLTLDVCLYVCMLAL